MRPLIRERVVLEDFRHGSGDAVTVSGVGELITLVNGARGCVSNPVGVGLEASGQGVQVFA
jgi:hypothetical protein